jgi:Protein of unknown function (DUF4232)
MTPRSEEDLRAAFRLAAQDAPSSEDVLAKLRAAQAPDPFAPARVKRSRIRQWLPIAAVAAVVIAIAVPVGFAISDGGNGSSSSASDAFAAPGKAAAPGASSAGASSAASGEIVEPGSGGAVGGPTDTAPVNPIVPSPTSAGALCLPTDVTLTLTWTSSGSGLVGTLTANNTGGIACDLAVKPAIYPLGANRVRLDVPNITSAEGYAGPTRLLPGATASSTLSWNSWCGPKADSGAQVDWGSGPATVTVNGPTSPSCVNGKSGNISSTWFGPLS